MYGRPYGLSGSIPLHATTQYCVNKQLILHIMSTLKSIKTGKKMVVTNLVAIKATNKAKNQAIREEQLEIVEVVEAKEPKKKEQISYLKEGVTGAQFTQAKRDTNKAVKIERATISRCIADIYEQDKDFFNSLRMSKNQAKKKFRPSTLLEYATDGQILNYFLSNRNNGYIKFNTWYTLEYMKKVLANETTNPNAVKFFEAFNANDERAIVELLRVITRARQ